MREYKLPEVLRGLMEENNLTQNGLALELETGQKQIYDWVREISKPSCRFLMAMSEFFDVPIDYLVYGDGGRWSD